MPAYSSSQIAVKRSRHERIGHSPLFSIYLAKAIRVERGNIPEMSSMSTWDASSFSFKVDERDEGVMPDVLATSAASASVSAALMLAKGRVRWWIGDINRVVPRARPRFTMRCIC